MHHLPRKSIWRPPSRLPKTVKLWLPMAGVALLVIAYAYFYELSSVESQGSASIGIANIAGLAVVVVGLIVAGVLFRRSARPGGASGSRNP